MADNNSLQASKPTQVNPVTKVKNILAGEDVKKRFAEVLGPKAGQFMASIVNVVSQSAQLQKCDPNSIVGAAYVAATYDLPVDSNLGFSAIVPYNTSVYDPVTRTKHKVSRAQFQMMYKGFIQLAIRSGQYADMSCSEVYEDELIDYNPITGKCVFTDDFRKCSQRMNGETEKIIGYYARFDLCSGFSKGLFMSKQEVENHARKYSQSYRYDLNEGKNSSRWSTDFDVMAKKTVIKQLLSKWGILSIDIQRAIQDDQKVYDEYGEGSYADNEPDVTEAHDPFLIPQDEETSDGNDEQAVNGTQEAVNDGSDDGQMMLEGFMKEPKPEKAR